MGKALVTGFLAVALLAGSAAPADLDAALTLFEGGADVMIPYSAEGRSQLEKAVTALREALAIPADLVETDEHAVGLFFVDSTEKDLLNKLSQAYYTLADVFLPKGNESETVYRKGKNWGLKSLRMNPRFVELEKKSFVDAVRAETDAVALYWACGNWLRLGEAQILTEGILGAAKCKAMAERCLEVRGDYICYGPYRTLGAYYGGLPPFLGQDLPRALSDYFCRVVNEPLVCGNCTLCPIDPSCREYFENRYLFVEFYLAKKGLWRDAKRVLESILVDPIGEKYPLYNAVLQERARNKLAEVEGHLK
jgi:hypothetical protein